MTTYCTLEDVKRYIDTDRADDDALLNELIARASRRIDTYCQRVFVAQPATRVFDAIRQVDGRVLVLDDDLLTVTRITNGDGTEITGDQYVLLPANTTPKWAVKLKASSGVSWAYVDDPEGAIEVEGTWGYAHAQPDDIRHAAIRLTAWFYHQRQAPFETSGMPELGLVTIPADIPADIKALLDPYVRQSLGGI